MHLGEVPPEVGHPRLHLAAHPARCLPAVHLHVVDQAAGVLEGLEALRTGHRALHHVVKVAWDNKEIKDKRVFLTSPYKKEADASLSWSYFSSAKKISMMYSENTFLYSI